MSLPVFVGLEINFTHLIASKTAYGSTKKKNNHTVDWQDVVYIIPGSRKLVKYFSAAGNICESRSQKKLPSSISSKVDDETCQI